jgi:hypothetical protein
MGQPQSGLGLALGGILTGVAKIDRVAIQRSQAALEFSQFTSIRQYQPQQLQ